MEAKEMHHGKEVKMKELEKFASQLEGKKIKIQAWDYSYYYNTPNKAKRQEKLRKKALDKQK